MAEVATLPKVEEPVVVPDTSDPYEMWEWLKQEARRQGRAELIHEVKERGECKAQTITKVMELSHLLGLRLGIDRFASF